MKLPVIQNIDINLRTYLDSAIKETEEYKSYDNAEQYITNEWDTIIASIFEKLNKDYNLDLSAIDDINLRLDTYMNCPVVKNYIACFYFNHKIDNKDLLNTLINQVS